LNKDINVEKNKKLMVKKYIETIEWCYIYYTDKCISWKHYYNFDSPPLIKDIIKYYPKNVNIDNCHLKLKPIEQLILVIPPKFYSFIMNKNILNKILTDKNFIKIKHLFPNNFDIDKNKETIEWKQHIILPFINYEYYLSIIQNILK
jgi:5'-3' exonuclease